MMEYAKQLELAVRLNRRVQAKYPNIVVGIGLHSKMSSQGFLYLARTDCDRQDFSLSNTATPEEALEHAAELAAPIFVPVTKVCIDLINMLVWINKKDPATVISIVKDRDAVLCSVEFPDGTFSRLEPDQLWIKE